MKIYKKCDCNLYWEYRCMPYTDKFIYTDAEDRAAVLIGHLQWEKYLYLFELEYEKNNEEFIKFIKCNYSGKYCYREIAFFCMNHFVERHGLRGKECTEKDIIDFFMQYLYWTYSTPYNCKNKLRKYFMINKSLKKDNCLRYKRYNAKTKIKYLDKLSKVRRSQQSLRLYLIYKYGQCQLCGINHVELLNVSHLKPFYICNDDEAYDEFNVLLLYAGYDKLLDKGYIAFDDDGKMIISSKLSDFDIEMLNLNKFNKLSLEEEHKKYIAWHRDNIFKK